MRPKQRFIAAMNHEKPDDFVSFMELEFQIYEEYIGKAPVVGVDFQKLSAKEKERATYQNAEIMIETAEKAGHDAIRNFGGYWEVAPGEPAFLWLPDEKAQLEQLKALKKLSGDTYFIIGNSSPTIMIPDGNHMLEFVYRLFDEPEEVKEELKQQLENAIEWQKRQLEAGADGIINCGDIAFNSGPFISPKQCDEFLFPYLNRWVDSLKREGVFSIWHTDGNLMPVMDRILESGVTAIQCVDPLANMDIIKLKQELGDKLTLIGNVNCVDLHLGTPAEIEQQVKEILLACKGSGGFVLSGCNSIFKGISAKNYQTMVDARYAYGRENE